MTQTKSVLGLEEHVHSLTEERRVEERGTPLRKSKGKARRNRDLEVFKNMNSRRRERERKSSAKRNRAYRERNKREWREYHVRVRL